MRKADYDQYYEYLEILPVNVEAMREIELELSQASDSIMNNLGMKEETVSNDLLQTWKNHLLVGG